MDTIITIFSEQNHIFEKIIGAITIFSEIYGFAAIATFAIICWIISIEMDDLVDRVRSMAAETAELDIQFKNHQHSRRTATETIKSWRQSHVTLLETVSCIQEAFSPFFLVFVIYIFVAFLGNAFLFSNALCCRGFDVETAGKRIFYMIRNVINLFVFCVAPVILNRKVSIIYFVSCRKCSIHFHFQVSRNCQTSANTSTEK